MDVAGYGFIDSKEILDTMDIIDRIVDSYCCSSGYSGFILMLLLLLSCPSTVRHLSAWADEVPLCQFARAGSGSVEEAPFPHPPPLLTGLTTMTTI